MTSERKKELLRILKFFLFSVSAGLIQIASFSLFNELLNDFWGYWPSYLISLLLSIIWNFTFNRNFTFKSASNVPLAMMLVLLFYAVFTPLSTLMGEYLTGIGWNEYLVLAITMVLNLILEFLYQRFVVFRKTLDTNKLAAKEKAAQSASSDVDENK